MELHQQGELRDFSLIAHYSVQQPEGKKLIQSIFETPFHGIATAGAYWMHERLKMFFLTYLHLLAFHHTTLIEK